MTEQLTVGMKVNVCLGEGFTPLPGTVTQIREGECPIKVTFDDPLVYGGSGAGWFSASVVVP